MGKEMEKEKNILYFDLIIPFEYYNEFGYKKFEGNYSNGKQWNGKGYDKNNKVIYELKDGKGFVKELSPHDTLMFEGEYINGERNGTGKEFYIDSIDRKLKFEGEYLNGKRWNGKGYDKK